MFARYVGGSQKTGRRNKERSNVSKLTFHNLQAQQRHCILSAKSARHAMVCLLSILSPLCCRWNKGITEPERVGAWRVVHSRTSPTVRAACMSEHRTGQGAQVGQTRNQWPPQGQRIPPPFRSALNSSPVTIYLSCKSRNFEAEEEERLFGIMASDGRVCFYTERHREREIATERDN